MLIGRKNLSTALIKVGKTKRRLTFAKIVQYNEKDCP
ncbi:hypothetical protein I656_01715 [Geobacillus sp. WSUCF1]|nr:hypothetical protein I656_01715 [Geobacillus sp. WSUCF1]